MRACVCGARLDTSVTVVSPARAPHFARTPTQSTDLLSLAGEAGDEGSAEHKVGDALAQLLEECLGVSHGRAVHELQDGVADVL